MQYILTEEEYKNLVPKSKYEEKCDEIKELQQLLMKATGHTCIHGENDYSDRNILLGELEKNLFPEVTFENNPQQVELELINYENEK